MCPAGRRVTATLHNVSIMQCTSFYSSNFKSYLDELLEILVGKQFQTEMLKTRTFELTHIKELFSDKYMCFNAN